MTAFNAMSHGTQDMYEALLGEQRHYGVTQKAGTGIIYAFGAICGGTVVGHLSQKWGRRRAIILCCRAWDRADSIYGSSRQDTCFW